MDLDLSASLIGRKAQPLTAEVTRELRPTDLALLGTERGIKASHVQRISDRHHALARCIATGTTVEEACIITGYTPSRVSVLKGDPAFEELVSFYRGAKSEAVRDLGEQLLSVAKDAASLIQERLEDTPETVSTSELMDLVKVGADRTGFGPKTTQVNVNVNLGDRLKAARERASSAKSASPLLGSGSAGEVGHDASPVLELKATRHE